MLRTPAAGEATPPLVARNTKIAPVSLPESFQKTREKAAIQAGQPTPMTPLVDEPLKKRKRNAPTVDDTHDWDKIPQQRIRVGKRGRRPWGKIISVAVATLALVVGVLYLIQRRQPANVAPAPVVQKVEEPTAAPAPSIDLPLEMNRNQTELLAEMQPLVKGFLEATTVDEILPFVRNREKMEQKIRAYYPDGRIDAPGMTAFNTASNLAFRDKLASVAVRTNDFSSKQVAFIRTNDGLKIDWESFVGWSEMPWEDFLAKKPTKPAVFRASLRVVDYYNFSFSDEKKWQAYQLRSPDGQQVVYGYVKRDSAADKRLRPAETNGGNLVTVSLKFPLGESSKNQVLIEEILADGWVEGAAGK